MDSGCHYVETLRYLLEDEGILATLEFSKDNPPSIREEVAYHTLEIILSAYQSAKEKRVITL